MSRRIPTILLLAAAALPACAPEPAATPPAGARVGESAVPEVHLFEQHSHALTVWRRAAVRDRVVVHVDGHSDLDWLPEEAVTRFGEADPGGLERLEHHPYAMDGETYRSIGIWNFLYPAHRLGIVREVIWVVPDGTLPDEKAAQALVRDLIAEKMHGVSLAEATRFRWNGTALEGVAAGVPLRIVELAHLRVPDEPVLLDVDLDYLTTRSAANQEVAASPWIVPSEIVRLLREAGVRTDLATVSYSTVGGFLPPAARWVGPAMERALREPGTEDPTVTDRLRAHRAVADGAWEEAVATLEGLVSRVPDDAANRYLLAVALAGSGRLEEGREERVEAAARDPILAEADLYEADARWLSGRWDAAEPFYRAYLGSAPDAERRAYATRRLASCLARTGRDEEAIALLREVLAATPDHADTHMDLGILLREKGDLRGCLAHLRRAREILPDRGTYAMVLGTTLAMAGDARAALNELRFAVKARPSWERARANLAAVAYQAGLQDEATEHVRAALALGAREPVTRRLAAGLGLLAPGA